MDDKVAKQSNQARKRREREIKRLQDRILKISRERKRLQNITLKHRTVDGVRLAPRQRTEEEEDSLEELRQQKLDVEKSLRRLQAEN